MQTAEFFRKMKQTNFSLSRKGDKLLLQIDGRTVSSKDTELIERHKDLIGYIREHKDELMHTLTPAEKERLQPELPQISSIYRLSGIQEGMLFHSLYEGAGDLYIEQFACHLHDIRADIFARAWQWLTAGHSILRSAFVYDRFKIPVQCVYREVGLAVYTEDLRALTKSEQQVRLAEYTAEDRRKGFDLSSPPLMRVSLFRLDAKAYRMLWTFHHAVMDGWSLGVLKKELLGIYDRLARGEDLLPREEDRFEDYIRYIERQDKEKEQRYWTDYLKNTDRLSLLPFVDASSDSTKGAGQYKQQLLCLDETLTHGLHTYVRRHLLTMNTLVLGAWSYLLSRYTGNKDVLFGVTVSGRPEDLPEVEKRVGLYINTIPFYATMDEERPISDWLTDIMNDQLLSRQYQYTSLSDIRRWKKVQGDMFDSLVVFQNYPGDEDPHEATGLDIIDEQVSEHTNYPLCLVIAGSHRLHVYFEYNANVLDEVYVREISEQFGNVLAQMIADDKTRLSDLRLLTQQQQQQLLKMSKGGQVAYLTDKMPVDLFRDQAMRTPDAVAVVFEDQLMSYRQLDERSDQLGHRLRRLGVVAETPVGICMERNQELVTAILGVMKAGGAYVPIDPDQPADRIAHILSDTAAPIVLVTHQTLKALPEGFPGKTMVLDGKDISHEPVIPPAVAPGPDSLAYIIYTSGSTGRPKGVMIEHRNLLHVAMAWRHQYGFQNIQPVVFSVAGMAFDVFTGDIFRAVLNGGKIILAHNERRYDPVYLYEEMKRHRVNYFESTPVLVKELVRWVVTHGLDLSFPDILVVGSDVCHPIDFDYLRAHCPGVRVLNSYGVTEAAIDAAFFEGPAEGYKVLPIGRPMNNICCYILDEKMRLLPKGCIGELYIAGRSVGRGYLNLDDLTAGKFMADPYSSETVGRMYRTGDMARWLPEGNIEFAGRVDTQLKVRGYRIEPGEIESVVQGSGLVRQVVIAGRKDASGVMGLVGYVAGTADFSRERLIAHLRSHLPEYMIPLVWVELESLPLNSNGKVDRKALPEPERTGLGEGYAAPCNAMQQALAGIWQEVLGAVCVGIHDNFFELGGHSLLAMRVVSAIRQELKRQVSVKALFQHVTVEALAVYLQQGLKTQELPTIQAGIRPARPPLSFGQERLWFIDQLEGSIQYHIPEAMRIRGLLDKEALSRALRDIVRRHEVLRTVIKEEKGIAWQEILSCDGWEMEWRECNEEDLQLSMTSLLMHPMDLSQDFMLRATLIGLGPGDHVLVLITHHIASDGWSSGILLSELRTLYGCYANGVKSSLPEPALQYADYALWQRNHLSGELLNRQLDYWKKQLAGVETLLLPVDHSRRVAQSRQGASLYRQMGKGLSEELRAMSQREGCTLFMVLLAVFKILLNRWSGQPDICVGSPIAGRIQKELEGLIGFFVNSLALRSDLGGDPSVRELLQRVRITTLDAYEHQELPFEKVVEAVVRNRDMNHSPLFQVMFILQNTAGQEPVDSQWSPVFLQRKTAAFELTFCIVEEEEGLGLIVEYQTGLYEGTTMSRMMDHYIQLLQGAVKDPEKKIGELPMMGDEESRRMMAIGKGEPLAYEADATVISLFREQALRVPDAVALVFEERRLSYRQLEEQSNQVAHYLRKQGVGLETPVCICMERSPELLIGLLGIMKAGGAYVPVDPEYPAERVQYMLSDTGAPVVVDMTFFDQAAIRQEPVVAPAVALHAENLAYIMYTSGSTGTPKGVMVEHRNIVSLARCGGYFPLTADDVHLGTASPGFDVITYEYWGALLNGGRLVLCSKEILLDHNRLKSVIRDNKVNKMFFTTGWFNQLVDIDVTVFEGLEMILVGGEKLSPAHIDKFRKGNAGIQVFNGYGPTENCAFSLYYEITRFYGNQDIPIGRPLGNRTAHVLNGLQLAPVGVAGEICVGGVGMARGYLGRKELTAEKFIPDPCGAVGERIYRTGDIGRWLPDGNMEYLGRMDEQLKVRGHRIEPGEIEAVVHSSGLVKQVVITGRKDAAGVIGLIGYVVGTEVFDRVSLLNYLKTRLPAYMIPSVWMELEQLPLNSNGKVDKRALPEPERSGSENEYVAPRNELEEQLAAIWQEMLGIERIGVYDEFFESGGHSLLAMRMVSAIRHELQRQISVKTLFQQATVAALAIHLQGKMKLKEPAAIRAGVRPERAPLSFGQERLWFIHQLEGSVQYHIPEAIRIRGDLRREALSSALREIVRRHEVLRTVIKEENEVVWQETLAWEEWELGWIEGGEDTLQPLMTELLLQPMDLTRDFMLRATLIGLGPGEHVLVLITHHIASDGWSAGILLSELWTLYGSFTKNEELSLPKLPLQYTDYACWQRNHLSGLLLEGHIDYWKQKLSGVEMLMLPVDHSHLPEQGRKGANLYRRLGKELSEGLRRLSRQQECTLFMILLTVFKILLSRWSGQQDICVGSPIAGRTQRELEGLIGFFVNTLALRSDLSGDPSVQELLQRVRVTALDAYEHQEIPFEKVVEAVVRQRDLIRNPLFQVMFILQHVQEQALPTPEGLEWSPVLFVQKTAVFELTFCVTESPEELGLIVEYCVDLYEEATITRMMDHFIQLLQAVVRHPEKKISELPMLGDMESRRMVEMGKGKVIAYDRAATVVSLFSEQALQMQEAAAVVFEDRILSYRQLDESSTRLANYLKKSGVGVETPVAVCMERSPELLIGMLGIMKAGGAYVPIDPDYPVERIAYMLSDTGVSLVLCSPASKAALPEGFSGRAVLVDDAGQEPVTLPLVALQSGNLAYVMYTSGSTGRPKGVMVEHRNITSLVKGGGYMSLTSSDVLLGAGSPSFDAITHEYWGALLNGGKLVLCSKHTLLDHRLFKTVMQDNKVNKMFFTTGWFNQLVDAEVGLFAGLEVVMVGGEKLSPGHIDKFYKAHPCIRLFNVYGPTENTTFSLICPVAQPYGGEDPPIGRPLGNRSAYILNALQLAPAGVPGEICVGGDGVARGYFGQRELTAEKFLPDLFGEEGGRIYRTGDIGKWLPDGNIAYLGRMDEQLKIRGHRIEPGEIESVVQASGMVHQVVVLGRKDTMGRMGLVGYVVAGGNDFDRQGMVSYLQQFLPEYMIPPLWVEMEEMPLNSSGKVDRRALPEPERKGPEDGYVAARDETEEQLVTIWQEVLGMERIGVHDNFFQLGGNSLIMLSLLKKIRQLCPTIYLKDLFIHQTVGRLAMFIAEKMGQDRRDGMEWADGHLILLNDADGSRPLFVIPGSQGFSDGYDELARAFDGRYTVYGIQMRGTKGSEQPVQDMVEIAALNIASIKTVQPEGPYRLVAHCFGAHAAYEMVRQLEAAGDEVAFVAMLDISVILNRLRIEGDNIPVAAMMASIRNLTRSFKLVADPLPEWLQTLEATLHALPQEERVKHIATCLHEQYPGRKDAVEFVVRLFHLEMVNVLVKYTPADSIGCPLVVVKAEEEDWRGYEPDLGWSERAPMHHVITSPGNHNSMVRGEHAVLLAHRLLAVTGDV